MMRGRARAGQPPTPTPRGPWNLGQLGRESEASAGHVALRSSQFLPGPDAVASRSCTEAPIQARKRGGGLGGGGNPTD